MTVRFTPYLIEVDRPGNLDEVTVKVEISNQAFSDRMDQMRHLHERITQEIHTVAGIRTSVELVEPKTLQRFAGKAQCVHDLPH